MQKVWRENDRQKRGWMGLPELWIYIRRAEKGGEGRMTVREAILTLRANAILACERAGFTSATVKMVEDALDIIDKALQAYEPMVMTLEELDDLRGRGRAVWFEDRDGSTKCKDVFFIVASDIFAYFNGETYQMIEMIDDYGKTWRCWTSRPTDELREATPWQT